MSNIVLIIAAHPDDEVLGCGGTIARHASQGDDVHILIMAEGITSRDSKRDADSRGKDLSILAETAQKTGSFLGAKTVELLSYPDNRMDTLPLLDLIKAMEIRLERIKPSIVYTHHHADLNIDHQVTHQAVITACRPYPGQSVRTLLFFEVPSSTEWQIASAASLFVPNWFVDISGGDGESFLEKKIHALEMYNDEMRPFPHPRSHEAVKYLSFVRGVSAGVEAAEGYRLGKLLR